MTKIDIFSGFLGAGKTTLIKKLINETYKNEKLVLIENEFGEIGIDGSFLKDAGVEITEMNSGCICCSLVGDFSTALKKVIADYSPDRILIEPSGVGKLSDVIKAVKNIDSNDIALNGFATIVDATKCKMYMKNFGEFFNDQIEYANTIILSHTESISEDKLHSCLALIKEHNEKATIVTTPWSDIDGDSILNAIEQKKRLEDDVNKLLNEHEHHHHHDDDCDCEFHEHHHEHNHNEECDCESHEHHHEHHKYHHDEECNCDSHSHEHHHHHDENCTCGCHEHHHNHEHHHHHHADEVFTSIGRETTNKYTADEIRQMLLSLQNKEIYGTILRAKGIVSGSDGEWIHFDYVPGEPDVRYGSADIIGRLCVIGSEIHEDAIEKLFKL